MKNQKPWSGRFKKETHARAEEMNASISFDRRLYRQDILGSIAHARVLRKAGILSKTEAARIIKGLRSVEKEMASGRFRFTPDMEDIHMAVEKRLTEKIGAAGGKLHTGRSRNDQVSLDERLYLKDEINGILALIRELQRALVEVSKKNLDCIMPGYTHMQRAQPMLFSHHLLAYYEMLKRDKGRMTDCLKRTDSMPLGSGALAGSPYRLDRRYCAKLLGFSAVTENSLDAVSDRDFAVEFLASAAIVSMHLSRLGEELILWSTEEFGFIELSDAFSTGSSMMPQKKNPDIAELARGKTGRVYGNLITLLTVMKALPLAYNKDMQEDKEPLFDTVRTLKTVLGVFPPMLRTMKVNRERMREAASGGFLTATDAADYLAARGMPFRGAHNAVGKAVAYCLGKGIGLTDLGLKEWKRFSPLFGSDIKRVVSAGSSVNARRLLGGTALPAVKKQLKKVEMELKKR
ncbi:MAG: argininosuccinate lyase [Deltaproteobacteria bacterium]|nr:argininosuccinate lyase [Deltaproteobacteria bacterium]